MDDDTKAIIKSSSVLYVEVHWGKAPKKCSHKQEPHWQGGRHKFSYKRLLLVVISVLYVLISVVISVLYVLICVLFVPISVLYVLIGVLFVLISVMYVHIGVLFVLMSVLYVLISVLYVLISVVISVLYVLKCIEGNTHYITAHISQSPYIKV
jgi:hypothetical protein